MSIVNLDNKTILVTGAAGFIGSNLVKRIYQEAPSATVIGIDNMNAYYDVALKEFRFLQLQNQVLQNLLLSVSARIRYHHRPHQSPESSLLFYTFYLVILIF